MSLPGTLPAVSGCRGCVRMKKEKYSKKVALNQTFFTLWLSSVQNNLEQALWPGPCRPFRQFVYCRCNGTSCNIHCMHGPGALLSTTIAGACLARLKYSGTRAERAMRPSFPDGTARPRPEGLQQRSNNLFLTNLAMAQDCPCACTLRSMPGFAEAARGSARLAPHDPQPGEPEQPKGQHAQQVVRKQQFAQVE